jgi:hypothetical protein
VDWTAIQANPAHDQGDQDGGHRVDQAGHGDGCRVHQCRTRDECVRAREPANDREHERTANRAEPTPASSGP